MPRVTANAAFKQYAKSPAVTSFHEFDGAGHSLTVDRNWRTVADITLSWLAANAVV